MCPWRNETDCQDNRWSLNIIIAEEFFEAVETKSLCFALPVSLIVVSYDLG